MIVAQLKNLSLVAQEDFCMEPSTYAKMRAAGRANADVAVLEMECQVDDVPEHCYFNVALADGTILEAISGMHLVGIENWK